MTRVLLIHGPLSVCTAGNTYPPHLVLHADQEGSLHAERDAPAHASADVMGSDKEAGRLEDGAKARRLHNHGDGADMLLELPLSAKVLVMEPIRAGTTRV